MSARRLLGVHLPAASLERRETVAGECLGWLARSGRRRLGMFRCSRTAGGGGPGPRSLLGRMPERRWRVLGRGRGLFAIEVDTAVGFRCGDDGRGGHGAAAVGAVRGGGVPVRRAALVRLTSYRTGQVGAQRGFGSARTMHERRTASGGAFGNRIGRFASKAEDGGRGGLLRTAGTNRGASNGRDTAC